MIQEYMPQTNGREQFKVIIDSASKTFAVFYMKYNNTADKFSYVALSKRPYIKYFAPKNGETGLDLLIQTTPTTYIFISKQIWQFQKLTDQVIHFESYRNTQGEPMSFAIGYDLVYLFNYRKAYPVSERKKTYDVYTQYNTMYLPNIVKNALAKLHYAKHCDFPIRNIPELEAQLEGVKVPTMIDLPKKDDKKYEKKGEFKKL